MKKVLITGAGGFVGGHLINLLKNDYFIIALTHPNPLSQTENMDSLIGNILDKSLFDDAIRKYHPDVIIHLAAKAATWETDPEDVFKVNLFGTLNLYKAVLSLKQQQNYNPKIIYISSAEVYGKTRNMESVSEEDPFFPVNFYGVSKLSADRLSYQYSQSHKLNIIIIRPFNHTGPGQAKGFFVPDMASQIAEIENDPNRNELMAGNLESIRDFTDVRDIVKGYKLVIEQNLPPGESYNICSSKGIKMNEVLNILLSLANKKISIKNDTKRMRPSDIPLIIGNNTKFTQAVSWNPQIPFEQTLKDTLDYWRSSLSS